MKARFVHQVGTRGSLRRYWGDDCPSCLGRGGKGYHNAEILLGVVALPQASASFGRPEDYADGKWPTKCDHCPALVPAAATKQVFTKTHYNTTSGDPEPGDLYYVEFEHWDHPYSSRNDKPCQATACIHGWVNCDGQHLHAILPNGAHWNIDGRASNCTMPDDQVHRCWVRHGEPPNIHVDKSGNTCSAGAGSIADPGWHGFLHNGQWVKC